jgi:oligoendopeptidase F
MRNYKMDWKGLSSADFPLTPDEGDAKGGRGLPSRADIDAKYQWRLEDMYSSIEAWNVDAEAVLKDSEELSTLAGRLGDGAENLLTALKLQDEIGKRLSKMFAFARMRRDEDNTNATYQALTDKAMSIAVRVEGAKAFLVPEILELPESQLQTYLQTNSDLGLYEFVITDLVRQKAHVLPTEQEALLAAAGEVTSAPSQIFTMFNNADLKFPMVKDDDGEEIELTHGRYIHLMESTNQEVRKAAFEAMYKTYGANKNTLAAVYGASVKKDIFYASVRSYESARQAALDDDNVPVSVYDNLIAAVHESLPALHKYLRLRKRVLGLDELHMYDIYTPLVSEMKVNIPYSEALTTVGEAIAPLGEEYQRIAREGMQSGWIDVYETKGKTSGAYSWGAYGVHPYILLNYQESLDNMFTLAHELGHAMHTYYSHANQPFVYSGYTIFVAEVASTCNEALLTDYLLKRTDDKQMRAYLLNHQLETIRGTLFRQTMFAEFEKLTHQHAEEGGALTPDWLSDTYYKLNEAFFGAECVVDPDIAIEWARIPHFYTPFYVYKYATGISASTALSQKILHEGPDAAARYMEFLKSGGSDYPIELLRKAGVDMESPEPVRATLKQFSEMVDELAAILEG